MLSFREKGRRGLGKRVTHGSLGGRLRSAPFRRDSPEETEPVLSNSRARGSWGSNSVGEREFLKDRNDRDFGGEKT